MFPTQQGSIHLFTAFGIRVHLHWSWFLIAMYSVQRRQGIYESFVWNIYEYLALFGIVLMHEFGHSLATKQVGGTSDQIVLWPLGGVAYVQAPARAGAQLWSIAAGPLVNVALLPVFWGLHFWARSTGYWGGLWDVGQLIYSIALINTVILCFNLLPVYPLDGGQILRSLLWYKFGPIKSLRYAAGVGLVGAIGLGALAVYEGGIWLGVMVAFLALNAWRAWQSAGAALRQGTTY